jgi:hypothetical protein
MSITSQILAEIKGYCDCHGIAETTFGRMAVNDGKLVQRLRAGRTVTLATLERIRAVLDKREDVAS